MARDVLVMARCEECGSEQWCHAFEHESECIGTFFYCPPCQERIENLLDEQLQRERNRDRRVSANYGGKKT